MINKCPGQQNKRDLDSVLVPCPDCGRLVEFFTDEPKRTCRCGHTMLREALPKCADWCPAAAECLGEAVDIHDQGDERHKFVVYNYDPKKPREASAVRHRITFAIAALNKKAVEEGRQILGHITPHGLRSYFVTQARQSGLTDAEIAMLIGDKTGPSIIATTYGDLRPDHLLAQARRIRLTVTAGDEMQAPVSSHQSSHTLPQTDRALHPVSECEQAA